MRLTEPLIYPWHQISLSRWAVTPGSKASPGSRADLEQRWRASVIEGQLPRVALARTLALKPLALLLDEPTSNSDREHRQVFEQRLLNLKPHGTTVVFASHDLKQSRRLDAEVLPLAHGRLLDLPGRDDQEREPH